MSSSHAESSTRLAEALDEIARFVTVGTQKGLSAVRGHHSGGWVSRVRHSGSDR